MKTKESCRSFDISTEELIQVRLKGADKLRAKLPDYSGRRIGLIPLRGFVAAIIGYSFMILFDVCARVFTELPFLGIIEPFLPFVGTILVGGTGILFLRRIWNRRDEMKTEYGDLAYQKMFPTGVVGISLLGSFIIHAFTSIRSLPPGVPVNPVTTLWSQSILHMIGLPSVIDIVIRLVLSTIFLLIGILLMRSAVLTFGIDNMTVVYLYFPEESEIQENEKVLDLGCGEEKILKIFLPKVDYTGVDIEGGDIQHNLS